MRQCVLCGSIQHLFSVPKNLDELSKWSEVVGVNLSQNNKICANHFRKEDIICDKTYKIHENVVTFSNIRKLLSKGSIPLPNSGQSCSSSSSTRANTVTEVQKHSDKLKTYNRSYKSHGFSKNAIPETTHAGNDQGNSLFNSILNYNFKNMEQWGVHKHLTQIIYTKLSNYHLSQNSVKIEKAVIIDKECNARIILNDYTWKCVAIANLLDFDHLFEELNNVSVCSGKNNRYSKRCNRIAKNQKSICCYCQRLKTQRVRCNTNTTLKRFNYKLRNKIQTEKQRNLALQKLHTNQLNTLIHTLPDTQKEMVEMCIKASKRSSKGNRYTADWMYSCILMKIKSPKLYCHMRERKLLPLPSNTTLYRYIKNLQSSFGFQDELFNLITKKTRSIPEYERHGTLMIDECKISESKHFDRNKMEIIGFVDLGIYTTNSQKDKLGDHILVFMFQSFSGKNMQALGCFLTKGNITGRVQARLALECIILCENAGLYIDVITSDGATWNRAMWKCFGVDNYEEPWLQHPLDDRRKLRMCSYFPHLLKCVRNRLVSQRIFQVPEGLVKLDHFSILLRYEESFSFKLAYKLTARHIDPQNHEKMTNSLAFQLFSETNAMALEKYKDVPGLEDSAATAQFCRRLNALSDVLNSNHPKNALYLNSKQYSILEDFLLYLNVWEQCADSNYYLTKSTSEGLVATIKTTIDLLQYLTTDLGFKYLMTTRINQDPLEHFFGLMRAACGDNSHPDSSQVAKIFKLMSLYSLIKPPRGSNITGGNMLTSLVNSKDILKSSNNVLKNEYLEKLDQLVEEDIQVVAEELPFYDNEEAFAYVCGYIARRYKSKLTCSECFYTFIGTEDETYSDFIRVKSKGSLVYPSPMLLKILKNIETTIRDIIMKDLKRNALLQIIEVVATSGKLPGYVGCDMHKKDITKQVIFDFLMTRIAFCCKEESRKRIAERSKRHGYAKLAKLV